MGIFHVALIVSFSLGIGLIIYSIVDFHGLKEQSVSLTDEDEYGVLSGYVRLEEKLNRFDSSLSEADETINELSDMSKTVFKEFDDKYQELLFLYNLVDEKKQELLSIDVEKSSKVQADVSTKKETGSVVDIAVNDDLDLETKATFDNPKLAQIRELQANGMDISDIAKEMGIGKGEVSLILELSKGR